MDQGLGGSPLEQRVGGERPSRTAVALSPDGKTLVFGAIWGGEAQLHARAMDQLGATPMPGTRGGSSPFFSPDGQWVGFWVGRRAQEGSSERRPAGDTVQGGGDLRGQLGQRRHHRVRDRPERGLVAGVGRGGRTGGTHDASAGRIQSPVAPHVARRPRCDLHDLEGRESMGQHTDRRAVPCNGQADRSRHRGNGWALCADRAPGLRSPGNTHGRSLRLSSTRRYGRRKRTGGRCHAGREP